MQKEIENVQSYEDPIGVFMQACFDYKAATIGMINPDEGRIRHFRITEVAYKKAIKDAIKYLKNELKSVEESCWSSLVAESERRETKL